MLMSSFALASTCEQMLGKKLCYKIGQMLIVGFGGFAQTADGAVVFNDSNSSVFNEESLLASDIRQAHIGGVIFFSEPVKDVRTQTFIRYRNIVNPQQLIQLTTAILNYSRQTNKAQGLPNLPLLLAVDEEGGGVDRLNAAQGFFQQVTLLPQALGMDEQMSGGNTVKKKRAWAAAKSQADLIAKTLHLYHFNVDFAPVVDVDVNPVNPIIGGRGRSFSSNPAIVVNQAKIFIQALHQYGIVAAIKHFPGHGSSSGDTHAGLVDVTDTYQPSKELYPYEALFKLGYVDMVMTTHVINGQIDRSQCKKGAFDDHLTWCPGTMSKKTLTGLLRNKLKFNGVIVSDDMTMGAITKEYPLPLALEKAINAGVDMFIVSNNQSNETMKMVNTIARLVKQGKIKRSTIDRAYQRIAKLKKRVT